MENREMTIDEQIEMAEHAILVATNHLNELIEKRNAILAAETDKAFERAKAATIALQQA